MNKISVSSNGLLLSIGLTLSIGMGVASSAPAAEPLFDVESPSLESVEFDPAVVRSRPIEIRGDVLDEMRERIGAQCVLNLFEDVSFVAETTNIEVRSPTSMSVSGVLLDAPPGTFYLVIENKAVITDIWTAARGIYHLRPDGKGSAVVREINEAHLGGCGTGPQDVIPYVESATEMLDFAPDPNMVDVMVVYTPTARDQAGGEDAVRALIRAAVGLTHGAYFNSGITAYLRLVRCDLISFDESGRDTGQMLGWLQNPTDGIMDEVHGWRDEVGADLVVLVYGTTASDGATICGRAYVTSNAGTGFSVVRHTCATTPNWTFAHEIGHNFGANHDHNEGVIGGAFTYAYGHLFTDNHSIQRRTIMVRQNQPGSRIQYFSNPAVNFDGQPTGIIAGQPGEADNRLCHNNRAATLSGFRDTVSWIDFTGCNPAIQTGLIDQPFCSMGMAIYGSFEGSIIRIRAGTSSEASTITMPCRLEAVGGSVTIGAQ